MKAPPKKRLVALAVVAEHVRDDDLRTADRKREIVHERDRTVQLSSGGSIVEPLVGARASSSSVVHLGRLGVEKLASGHFG